MKAARRAVITLTAIAAAVLALAPAAAAAPLGAWLLPPTAISAPSTAIAWYPLIASGGTGTSTTTAVWMFDRTMYAAIRRGSAGFGSPITITDNLNSNSPALAIAQDGAAWVAHAGIGASDVGAGVVRVGTDGTLGTEHVLTTNPAYGLTIAVGADGTVAVAWSQLYGSCANYCVRAAVRTPAGTWGDPVTLSNSGRNDGPQVAIAPDGTVTVAWSNDDAAVQHATRPSGSGSFLPLGTIDGDGGNVSPVRIGVAADGTAVLAWTRSANGSSRIWTAERPPGGSFGGVEEIGQPSGVVFSNLSALVVHPNGDAEIAWCASDAQHTSQTIYAATRTASGTLTAPVPVSSTVQRASEASMALAGDGSIVIGWTERSGAANRVRTATRPPGASFNSPVTLETTTDTRAGEDRPPPFAPQLAATSDGGMTAVFFSVSTESSTLATVRSAIPETPGTPATPASRYAVTVQKVNGALGTVTADTGGIDCGSTCVDAYARGTKVTLTARGTGGVFARWSGACSGSAATCTIDIDTARNVTAHFAVAPEARFRVAPGGRAAPTVTNPANPNAPIAIVTTVIAPGPGAFTQSGATTSGRVTNRSARVCQTRFAVRGAGTYSLRCRLTTATRAVLRRHAIRVAITTRFTTPQGKWSETTRVVVIPKLPRVAEPVVG